MALVIKELQWKAEILNKTGYVRFFDVGVIKSDTVISKDLQEALKERVRPLNDAPGYQEDHHPRSDHKVFDLVHPSLFPVIYGRTHVLPDRVIELDDCIGSMGQGELLPVPPDEEVYVYPYYKTPYKANVPLLSQKFQWLPCDVELTESGCRIVSYINNLHPMKHRGLYDAEEDAYYELLEAWDASRPIILPEPGEFRPHEETEYKRVDLRKEFPGQRIQVIVKLANIELTPESPEYEGGSWHIEGQLNERIAASAIYYYDSENITPSTLSFRRHGRSDFWGVWYQQRHEFLQAVFGFGNDTSGYGETNVTQELGSVLCQEGRLLTFPNTVQHRVSSFSLADRSKPGHRKILALFLVDPHRRIISSANVRRNEKIGFLRSWNPKPSET
ncbi:hypothetical protein BDV30DRAFT_235665 [Aspergillus minisclerotigenes]|uniref:DUF4246 domain-containing protein n=1 Tax=Aspergillus minisclerotigenes TaxID=656917 RepID=A0A5N6JFK3_9EURO|nr:hypothetical protein BDV30DRAFT_235665 [Aspergillus minisclerotigenes]